MIFKHKENSFKIIFYLLLLLVLYSLSICFPLFILYFALIRGHLILIECIKGEVLP